MSENASTVERDDVHIRWMREAMRMVRTSSNCWIRWIRW